MARPLRGERVTRIGTRGAFKGLTVHGIVFNGKFYQERNRPNKGIHDAPQEEIEIWEPTADSPLCPECKGEALERLRDVSVLYTYRCVNKHKWYLMCGNDESKWRD